MSLTIALIDAATNCEREGATVTLTLRSGVQIKGKLARPARGSDTAYLGVGLGWATVLIEEIAAVEAQL